MWRICGILLFQVIAAQRYYKVPEAKLQAFAQGGFQVSIPDSPDIQLFAFHGNLNKPLNDVEAGQWNRDIVKPRNGRWTFEEPDVRLKLGDVIYYWILVQVDGLAYTKTNQYWVVSAYDDRNEDRIGSHVSTGSYEVPDAKLEALYPKGLRVSIPDEPGVELFAFHGKVNTPLAHDLEAGTMSRDILRTKNGRWVYQDDNVRLRNGDVIYYWLYVKVDGIGYQKLNQKWIVTAYDDRNENRNGSHVSTGSYEVPDAKLEALYPKGLRVSIPDEPGVELFAFHGNVNTPLAQDLEAGTMSRDILSTKNGRWIYQDDNVRLRNGDVIYYWLYVKVDGIGYQKLNQKWIVTAYDDRNENRNGSHVSTGSYEVPDAKLEALYPKGLRVSIPDEPGVELFAFHGNVNTPLAHELESGTMSRDILRTKNGRWIYQDDNVRLRNGDVIYYWLYVKVDGIGYQKLNQKWIVTAYDDRNEDRNGSHVSKGSYEVPDAKLEALYPKGLRVSIPDEPGVELFAFHGKVNTPLAHDLEAGTMSRDILRTKNGRWIYQDDNVRLRNGDVIYYWLYVKVDGIGYQKLNQKWIVTAYDDRNENRNGSHVSTGSYEVPDAKLEALYPKGLRVSIPDEPGVELFAFHGNVNTPLAHDLEAGTMSRDILRTKNGRWIYQDDNVRLKNGDVIYYWLYVKVDGIGYQKLNQKWIVTGVVDSVTTTEIVSGPTFPPVTQETVNKEPANGDFFQLDFKLPEGMELVVVVKDGKLLIKKPLPSQIAFENAESVKIGHCKATNICVPSVGIAQRK